MAPRQRIGVVHAAGNFVGKEISQQEVLVKGSHALQQMKPGNLMEAMVAASMIHVDALAHRFLERSRIVEGLQWEIIDGNVNRAVRLLRLFNEQAELLHRLQGKSGQQRVVVEHVHVHEGGQAIVGMVEHRLGGGGEAKWIVDHPMNRDEKKELSESDGPIQSTDSIRATRRWNDNALGNSCGYGESIRRILRANMFGSR